MSSIDQDLKTIEQLFAYENIKDDTDPIFMAFSRVKSMAKFGYAVKHINSREELKEHLRYLFSRHLVNGVLRAMKEMFQDAAAHSPGNEKSGFKGIWIKRVDGLIAALPKEYVPSTDDPPIVKVEDENLTLALSAASKKAEKAVHDLNSRASSGCQGCCNCIKYGS